MKVSLDKRSTMGYRYENRDAAWGNGYCTEEKLVRNAFRQYKSTSTERIEQAYEEARQRDAAYYQMLRPDEYETLSVCVRQALERDNHVCFARYWMEHAYLPGERFASVLEQELKKWKRQYGRQDGIYLFRAEQWNSLNVDNTMENLGALSYGAAMLSNWKKGRELPPREAVIQLGIYFQMDAEEVNRLLLLAGRDGLYLLHLADAPAIYYLNRYAQEEAPDSIEGFYDRLLAVRGEIQKLMQTKAETDDRLTVLEKSMRKSPDGKLERLAYRQKVGAGLEEELEAFGKAHSQDGYRGSVTWYYVGKYGYPCTEVDFHTFLAEAEQELGMRRYRYQYLTSRFSETNWKYQKYRWSRNWNLTKGGVAEAYRIISEEGLYAGYREQESGKEENWSENKGRIALRALWKQSNCIEPETISFQDMCEEVGHGTRYKVDQLQNGREMQKKYVPQMGSKVQVMKYCVATGREDDLPEYLIHAGYWGRDLYEEASTCYWQNTPWEMEGQLDKTDSLMVYALLYRDALLEEWVNHWPEEEQISRSRLYQELKEQFPLMCLLMVINRDLQYAAKEICLKTERQGEREEQLKALCSAMVYPVTYSLYRWFSGYESLLGKRENEDE